MADLSDQTDAVINHLYAIGESAQAEAIEILVARLAQAEAERDKVRGLLAESNIRGDRYLDKMTAANAEVVQLRELWGAVDEKWADANGRATFAEDALAQSGIELQQMMDDRDSWAQDCHAAEAALATARRDALNEAADEIEADPPRGNRSITTSVQAIRWSRARAALVVAGTGEGLSKTSAKPLVVAVTEQDG